MTTATLAKSATAPANGQGVGEKTSESVIDRDSHFNGLYETGQNLRIEGVAEGEIVCEGTLTVAQGARVKAKVTAQTISIAGELEGEVVCRSIFQILPSGQVQATVSARRLVVQEGGLYNGEFRMITDAAESAPIPRPRRERSATPAKKNAGEGSEAEEAAQLLSTDEWWAKLTGMDGTKNGDSVEKES